MTPGQSCCGVITTHTHTHAHQRTYFLKIESLEARNQSTAGLEP